MSGTDSECNASENDCCSDDHRGFKGGLVNSAGVRGDNTLATGESRDQHPWPLDPKASRT